MPRRTAIEPPLVLGIESSCDDTACALVDGHGRVLTSVISSQLEAHRRYGGVVPEIASREHLRNWPAVRREAFERLGIEMSDVDVVAATSGPGLVGSLLVGLSVGRAVAYGLDLPFQAVHHLEGHLYSPFLDPQGSPAESIPARFIGLVVSGGHTNLFAVDEGRVTTLAETRDDAIGEAFDKIGKRIGLPYPQGPRVDELAEGGDATSYPLPVPRSGEELFFSYSGLKTQTLVTLEAICREHDLALPLDEPLPQPLIDLLAAFRVATVAQLVDRVGRLHEEQPIELLAVSGGVAANRLLRRELERWAEASGVALRLVPLAYSGDNAAMIAFAALLRQRRGERDDPLRVEAASRVPLEGASSD
ncbi:MAG: tRNA (adenosine(37)-N6)-threonylcarbamoyltransferase complex transferase subunit TsaD [Thermoanaerobaculia bacterium]|nr:tRNA (adenosine(37)-N6)-threonylcarbamoyltransferase complex transferase subunit TsaD [Thermoanaerobaculia bacterium]